MINYMYPNNLDGTTSVAMIIISLAIMLFCGFLMTRITKKLHLPTVTAYIVTGIIIGPYCLNMIPTQVISGLDFLPDIALSFIAFSAGEFFRVSTLKKSGIKVVIVTLFEALAASLLVFVATFFLLKLGMAVSIVLAALASTTAPASTLMTVRQTRSKGEYVDTLLQVIAIDDIVGLVAYSVAISIAAASLLGKSLSTSDVIMPLVTNIGVMIIGGLFGFLLKFLMGEKRSTDNRLIIAIATMFAFCGVCAIAGVSPLLGCMSMSTVYINLTDDDKLFKQLNYFSPPLLLLFFVRSGLNFNLDGIIHVSGAFGSTPLILISLVYFVVRFIGKYLGAYAGCAVVKKPANIRNYLGLALIPQASVAIGLAALGARTLGGDIGSALQTIILAASILYELVGPPLAKTSLKLAGAYSDKIEDVVSVPNVNADGVEKTSLQMLIERIQAIQDTIPEHPENEDEQAFTSAAEEHYEMMGQPGRRNKWRH